MRNLLCLTLLLCSLVTTKAFAENYREAIDATIKNSNFNGAVIVSKNGSVVWQEYIGFADKEQKIPLTAKHLFSPGSVAKELTTAAIMQLVEQGKLSYQDSVNTYISWLPASAHAISVEHILSHTSGLPKIKWHKGIDTPTVIEQIKNSKVNFEPGTGYLYSNLNVTLRALIVEAITKQPFSVYLKKHIFEPANMNASYPQLTQQDIQPNKVAGDYLTFINGLTVYMSPLDLMKFEVALTSGKLVNMEKVVDALPSDTMSGQKNRAYFDFGSFLLDSEGKLMSWTHDGSNPSHHTLKFHDFKRNYVIVLMSSDGNKSTLYKINEKISKIIKGQ